MPDDLIPWLRGMLESPEYESKLIERVERGERAALKLLLPYARDPRPTDGRRFARRILTKAGVKW